MLPEPIDAEDGSARAMPPRLVASVEQAMVARRAPTLFMRPAAEATEQLLHAMRTVKAARFTAAERLERKHMLSLFSMAVVSLYFVGLSVWQAVYAPMLDEPTNRLVTLVSILSSIFTLVLALIESMNDYKIKALYMHECGVKVNDLYHEFKVMGPEDVRTVQEFRRRYNEIVRNCPINHSRVDYLMARCERGVPLTEWLWARARYSANVYGLYGAALVCPPLIIALFH